MPSSLAISAFRLPALKRLTATRRSSSLDSGLSDLRSMLLLGHIISQLVRYYIAGLIALISVRVLLKSDHVLGIGRLIPSLGGKVEKCLLR